MRNTFFSSGAVMQHEGLALIRITTGILMIYHGYEIFDTAAMKGYEQWFTELDFPRPYLLSYLGKGAEFFGGILLVLGLFTRLAAIVLAVTMGVIVFGMGDGKILTDDQHPFLFILVCMVFFFTGAGRWSLDHLLFNQSRRRY